MTLGALGTPRVNSFRKKSISRRCCKETDSTVPENFFVWLIRNLMRPASAERGRMPGLAPQRRKIDRSLE